MSEDFTDDTTKSSPTIENRTPRKRGRSGAPQRHRRWSVVTVVVLFAAGALISATASEAVVRASGPSRTSNFGNWFRNATPTFGVSPTWRNVSVPRSTP